MADKELIPNLFRSEFAKIVAVLCKTYGIANLQLAEDLVSETFLKATETWGLKGVPDNPTAWLYTVAKNKTKDHFKHVQIFATKIDPELKHLAKEAYTEPDFEIDLSESNINDSLLQMLFAVCNPILSNEAQIGMALRILCGFGVDEIAKALLTSKATINKRLFRAKEKFRIQKIDLSLPDNNAIENRLDNVLSVLYLLFNEGYFSTTVEKTIRKDLCFESMRLLYLLLNNATTNKSNTNALMALFCFHASRFETRTNKEGEVVLYDDQDKNKWDSELIRLGEFYLNEAAKGNSYSKYHIEASIAFYHTRIEIDQEEKWRSILQLYNKLLQIEYSPIAALNRTYALAKAKGKKIAINEALKINLQNNYLYHALLADLYENENAEKRMAHLKKAIELSPTDQAKKVFLKKMSL